MNPTRFQVITEKYRQLRIAVLGDFCLDRYLEIDPAKKEISIETGLPVHNVVNIRSQPGGAGTILNNLVALGIGEIFPIGFCGTDGEGFELRRALQQPGVQLNYFFESKTRRTFTYCKPLVIEPGKAPVELNRLDTKNWTPTPAVLQGKLMDALFKLAPKIDALIVLDQVDTLETGVVTKKILGALQSLGKTHSQLLILADSRANLKNFPPVTWKMNRDELATLVDVKDELELHDIKETAAALARQNGKNVFVTLSEQGLLGASPAGEIEHVPSLPLRAKTDVVGAGDAVTANLATALAAGAELREALEIANAAASIVIHQLGTTGTAEVKQIGELLGSQQ